jgi:hypothetical protein
VTIQTHPLVVEPVDLVAQAATRHMTGLADLVGVGEMAV